MILRLDQGTDSIQFRAGQSAGVADVLLKFRPGLSDSIGIKLHLERIRHPVHDSLHLRTPGERHRIQRGFPLVVAGVHIRSGIDQESDRFALSQKSREVHDGSAIIESPANIGAGFDEDSSGWLSTGEFGHFMKLGAQQATDHVQQKIAAAKAAKASEQP